MATDASLRDYLMLLRGDLRNLIARFSPEEIDVFDDVFDNIIRKSDVIREQGENIIGKESTLGFFGSGALTLILAIAVSEAIRLFVEKALTISVEKIRELLRRTIRKTSLDLTKEEINELAEELARVLTKLRT